MPETEVAEQLAEQAEQKPYWYVDYAGFEQKQSRTNRLILGFRRWAKESTEVAQIFLNQKVKISTGFIHRNKKERLRNISQSWLNDPELHNHKLKVFLSEDDAVYMDVLKKKYPGLEVEIRPGSFDVFQLEMPYDCALIKRLPNVEYRNKPVPEFQHGNYDRNFRFDNDLLYRKVTFDKGLEDIICSSKQNDSVVLDSMNGINLSDERLSATELRNQVWFYADIEKPLFKYQGETRAGIKRDNEKLNIDRRERLLLLKEGKRNYKKKLEALVEGGKTQEQIHGQIDRIVGKLERKLIKNIAGYEVKLWEEKYAAKISWYTFILKKADGTCIRELHTLHDCGLDEINGYKIVKHATEKDLLNAVNSIRRKNNVAVFSNHNLPYDETQTRFASEETGAESMDFFIDGVEPRRDISKKVDQRMKKSIEYIDSYRIAKTFFPWLKDHKLETFAKERLGEGVFKKLLTYAQMRELEVRAINGDKEAARLMADYSTRDVEPVKKSVEEGQFLETFVKIRDMFPFLTLTEIAFSPNSVRKYFDMKHWSKNHNNRYEGKKRRDDEQAFKKKFEQHKKEDINEWCMRIPNVSGVHEEVLQVYLPLEYWLKDILIRVEPKWSGYYGSLSQDNVERFGQLRYPRAFLHEILMDYSSAINEGRKYQQSVETNTLGLFDKSATNEAYRKRAGRFYYTYGINIESVTDALKAGYRVLREELLERKAQVVCSEGEYLFLKGNLDSYKDMKTVIPIRTIRDYHVNPREHDDAQEQLSLGI